MFNEAEIHCILQPATPSRSSSSLGNQLRRFFVRECVSLITIVIELLSVFIGEIKVSMSFIGLFFQIKYFMVSLPLAFRRPSGKRCLFVHSIESFQRAKYL